MSVATRPVRAVPDAGTDAPASVTVTVRIDLPGGRLPVAAARLVESLRALAGPVAVHEPVGFRDSVAILEPVAGPRPVGGAARARGPGEAADPGGRDGVDDAADPGVLRVFLAARIVLRDGAPVRLTRREFDLLAFFCAHPRQVFDRAQLLRQVWGYEMVSGERTVDVHVRRLRVKLGEPGPLIATVRGVGYRLDEAARVVVVAGP
jgi:two-component system, OmpR family, response regulator